MVAGQIRTLKVPEAKTKSEIAWGRRLRQRQVAPELLQVRGHDRPSEGLRPLWRVELYLERDCDSRERGTQQKYLEHCHRPLSVR
jgi:hypothetical protein